MRRILSDRPIGKPAWSLARFLYGTWVSERLSGHLSKLQPNQAPCHLSNKFSLFKLSSSRMLPHPCGRPKWPPLRMDAASIKLDGATRRTTMHTRSTAHRGVASHHNESSIPDTYLNSCIPFFVGRRFSSSFALILPLCAVLPLFSATSHCRLNARLN